MKPLIILISTFIAILVCSRFFGSWNYILAGNVAMAAMLLFTAIGHFLFPKGMAMMLPGFIPLKNEIVFLTGVLEVSAAIGLLINGTRHITSLALILFFILVLPANINAAIKKVDFEKADHTGQGIDYLWFRVPLQIIFLFWVWFFGILAE